MRTIVYKLWTDFIRPLIARPDFVQVAAYCWRAHEGNKDILLITSSNNNWIIPKGWPINGMDGAQAALTEAWEEAGVIADPANVSFAGMFQGHKEMWEGMLVDARTHVYAVPVTDLADDYPEIHKRRRIWAPADTAADLVNDPALADFLRALA